jgi:hypothetical protein
MSNELAAFGSVPFAPALTNKPKALDKGYAPRLQLVATGNSKVVLEDKAKAGEFIVVDGQECDRFGKSATVVILGKLFKAVDFSGDKAVANYDPSSEEYVDIAQRQLKGGMASKCMFGPLYLAYHIESEQFVEIFLNSPSGKREEGKLDQFVPVGPEQAKSLDIEPRAPRLATLESRFVEKGQNKWFVFDTKEGPKSLNGVEPPEAELVAKACENFYKQAEVVEPEEEDRAR